MWWFYCPSNKGNGKPFPLHGAPSHRDRMMCLTHVNDNHFMMVIGDDDLYLVENLDPEKNVVAHKKVGDRVKIEKDESLGLDDCL
ncbi:hypothetical protein MTR_6g071585 [Medicago truncatula]|uniref:Uncharacterized protein n=1 Tax=Medicago truncatula TaxID=3880 RepID=A0A072UAD7_MEDTR|nr:hypothetical protein MTR_6g071585 [Medicago truncatula]